MHSYTQALVSGHIHVMIMFVKGLLSHSTKISLTLLPGKSIMTNREGATGQHRNFEDHILKETIIKKNTFTNSTAQLQYRLSLL